MVLRAFALMVVQMARYSGNFIELGVPGVKLKCGLGNGCQAEREQGECGTCGRNISPHVIIVGTRSSGDHCFVDGVEERTWSYSFNERHLHYPRELQDVGQFAITCVMVCDDRKDGTGGTAKIISGGVGHDHVRVRLQSGWLRGYRFRVAVYGRRVRDPVTLLGYEAPAAGFRFAPV